MKRRAAHPDSLHDVISGSNGDCLSRFEKETGASGCTTAQEGSELLVRAELRGRQRL